MQAMQRLVITGPTGWIGQALLAHAAARWGEGLADRVALFGSTARALALPGGGTLPVRELDAIRPDDVAGAHLVHLAYLTKEKAEKLGERVFFDTNLAIDDTVLAACEGRPASVFVASSGAAKLAAEGVDLHPYGMAKLRQEARFLARGEAAGFPVLTGRIFNIAGPYVNKLESYAVSNFIQQALRSQRISISAQIPVFRSLIHVDDLCRLVLNAGLALIGRSRAIDLCGAEVLEMEDIARKVRDALGEDIAIERGDVNVERPSAYLGHFPDTKTLAIQTATELRCADQCVSDTVAWLRQTSH